MKKLCSFVLLLFFAHQLLANTFYDQLCRFNSNWKKYKMLAPVGEARIFNSDVEYVQAHLSSVIPILRNNSVDHLSTAQYKLRMHLIQLLDAYRIAGNFPVNYYRKERIPVFIDQHQTHCAVGYLLQQTGYEELALRIAATDNYAWVKDIKETKLLEWQKLSGFTLEELKLIQGAYDYYLPNAFVLPNKYEVPQKPVCITAYFKNKRGSKKENIWCYGEGKNGVLNGRWEQHYSADLPWIVGYYENGKRSGQWEEYYQGTKQLCRTENWRNDQLNGFRKRFSRTGILIEEILFKDGNAITKTNYDIENSLIWVRKPLDSTMVWTEVYNSGGGLIANGQEKIYNPGNLLWFQNIELTALNSVSISARSASLINTGVGNNELLLADPFAKRTLYNFTPLVQYKKLGQWMYYKDCKEGYTGINASKDMEEMLSGNYLHFGSALYQSISLFDKLKINSRYDSIRVIYSNNLVQKFYGFGQDDFLHLQISYYDINTNGLFRPFQYRSRDQSPKIKEIGQFNPYNQKAGLWKHYDLTGAIYKTENFLIPRKEEEDDLIGIKGFGNKKPISGN